MHLRLFAVLALLLAAAPASAQEAPLRVFLRGGPKTHGPGQHDHPRFAEEWKALLAERGATVEAALRWPTEEELARTDVLVMYAAENGSIHGEERARLERFLARGGGLVAIHDAVCGDAPDWYKTVIGGAWKHGTAKWLEGTVDLYVTDRAHPISAGISNFRFKDEIYYQLDMDPAARVLVRGFHSVFDMSPQAWVLERDAYRAFVSIQGHEWESFSHPAFRTLLLRGIAWAGRRDADLLVSKAELAALRYPPGGPLAPEVAHEAIAVHPDFELALVASEPQVVQPISIDWDDRGRMWVALTPGYPEKERFSGLPAHDEIALLFDRDSDGRADERKTFYKGLDLVTSLVHHRDGVIVSAAPEILWLRDRDRDDLCDERIVLYSGFGFGDTHAVVSNLRWGPDGWIYATQGYSGNASRNIVNAAGKDFGHIGNGVLRFKPDGSAIEMVSSYGSNTWGLDFAPDGSLFFTMANGAHLRQVVLEERALAQGRMPGVESWADLPDHERVQPLLTHDDPAYAQIDFVGAFTAAAGSLVYSGGAWPEEWHGTHFVAEPTVHIVHHDLLAADGPKHRATKAREAEFLAGRDLWFRPVHMRTGPDGAMYLLDFYNQAVVHNDTRGPQHGPTNAAIRPDRDHDHGRIWRVQHKRATELPKLTLNGALDASLVSALEHPNSWQRMTAQRLLIERGGAAMRAPLYRLVENERAAPEGRVLALWTLALSGALREQDVLAGLRAKPPMVRAQAARVVREGHMPHSPALAAALRAQVQVEDARPRLEALAALQGFEVGAEELDAVAAAWPRLGDPWSRSAAVGVCMAAPDLALATLLASRQPEAQLVEELAARAGRTGSPQMQAGVVAALATSKHVPTPLLVSALALLVRERKGAAPELTPQLLQHLQILLLDPDPEVGLTALPLAAAWNATEALAQPVAALSTTLAQRLQDASAPLAQRMAALPPLLSIPGQRERAIETAVGLLDPALPLAEAATLVEALGRADSPRAARALCQAYTTLSVSLRERIFELLVTRSAWTAVLLEELEAERIEARGLGAQHVHRLRFHPDAALAERARAVLDPRLKTGADVEALLARLLPEVERPGGDVAKGRELFLANCASCHTVAGAGGNVGPDLTGIGAHGVRDLLPVILDPNRTVEATYSEWTVETHSGRILAGVLVRDGADSIVLRSATGDETVPRSDLASLRNSGRSPMPVGFESLGGEGLRDLFAYLSAGTEGFRVLDLRPVVSASTLKGLYDERRDARPMRFRRYGIQEVRGVPFEILDPKRVASGCNALVLKGGLVADWDSKTKRPQRVEVAVDCELERVHVLGGIAAWGHPYFKDIEPILKWTWRYADGGEELVVLKNGQEFADWIGRNDVPGSEHVPDLLGPGAGQVRYHVLAPSRAGRIASIVLESYDNRYAPTLIALTAELPGGVPRAPAPVESARLVLLGGGSSHDFERWFDAEDRALLADLVEGSVLYTGSTERMAERLAQAKVLVLSTNQPIAEEDRQAIVTFVEKGGGLVLLHAGTWRNWPDWKEHVQLAGGGTSSHESFGTFEVQVLADQGPLTEGLPGSFTIEDELYRFEPQAGASFMVTYAFGRSSPEGPTYPVLWMLARGQGKVVGLTLGHDGRAHAHPHFRTMLRNAVRTLLRS